jgi:3-oxoacyl-[acyl-carrier-protein] synthase-3
VNRPPVYLNGLAFALGELRPVDSLGVLREKQDSLEELGKRGVHQYAESPLRPAELAVQSIRETLEVARLAASEVDALIYASTSFWQKSFGTEREVSWLMFELGLSKAFPIGVFLPGCANFTSALRVAANLIRGDGLRNVLVVTTDRVNPGDPQRRVMWPHVSVLSDGAASALVSSEAAGFEVLSLVHRSSPAMWDLDPDSNLAAFLMGTVKGAQETVQAALDAADIQRSAVRRLITNNYNVPVMQMIARRCGFAAEQTFLDNVPRFAHAYAADLVINLSDCVRTNGLRANDSYCLLATGHKNWGGTVLRSV